MHYLIKRNIKIRQEEVHQLNNSDTFSGKPIGSEEFLNQMIEILGIILYIDVIVVHGQLILVSGK